MKVVIGVDPDAEKHGIAIYRDGALTDLQMMNTAELLSTMSLEVDCNLVISIENVMANQFVYARNRKGSVANQSKIAMNIGRCQQAQVELMRWLDRCSLKYMLFKPTGGNWAENKPLFERVTGWNKQSNMDTRSAAYFGYLALKSMESCGR